MPHRFHDILNNLFELTMQYAIVLLTFIFSILAKMHMMIKERKHMRKIESILETILCGFGSALAIYALLKLNLPTWLFCLAGGFSGLLITPIASTISKETTPILNLIVKQIKYYIQHFKNTTNDNP